MNKSEVHEHKQWSEKVRSQRFSPPIARHEGLWSNKRKSPVNGDECFQFLKWSLIFKNLKITANDVPNFVVKGMKCQN